MSTEYRLIKGLTYSLELDEHSSVVDLTVNDTHTTYTIARDLTAEQLCELAEKIIKVASYIAEDPNAVLDKYNVEY